MILGIDLSNIRGGGGITHISEILAHANPVDFAFKRVIVWGGGRTLSMLCNRSWLEKAHVPILDRSLPWRIWWQQAVLPKMLERNRCNLLFSPGGTLPRYVSVPSVTMSQNLLPFEIAEMRRFGFSLVFFRYLLLRVSQSLNFRKSNGMVFLTQYAHSAVMRHVKSLSGQFTIIPHGIDKKFFLAPKRQKTARAFSAEKPIKLLYVSIVNLYKHQWHVVEATAELRKKGIPVVLNLIGPAYLTALRRLKKAMEIVDPNHDVIRYKGEVPYSELSKFYHQADVFVFASSCENMPNILLEAMAGGLPIACSNRGPMPEILGDAGVYFDPEQPEDIAAAIQSLIEDVSLRKHCAWSAYERAQQYSWGRCSRETFSFLAEIGASQHKSHIQKLN